MDFFKIDFGVRLGETITTFDVFGVFGVCIGVQCTFDEIALSFSSNSVNLILTGFGVEWDKLAYC